MPTQKSSPSLPPFSEESHSGKICQVVPHLNRQMQQIADPDCIEPISAGLLRLVEFSYLDFDGRYHFDGKIVVFHCVAQAVLSIFNDLRRMEFPICRARPMNRYEGDDIASMLDNNTSGYNHRNIFGSDLISLHGYGMAIDINPCQNPWIEKGAAGGLVLPSTAIENSTNRGRHRFRYKQLGMAEGAKTIFRKNGFPIWGGDWTSPLDYQHFQLDRKFAEQLISMPEINAQELFDNHLQRCRRSY